MKTLIVSVFFLLYSYVLFGQDQQGIIIHIEDNVVYLDLTNAQTKNGDQYKVVKSGGTITHPITKEIIQKKDEIVCILTINDISDSYSTAIVKPENAIYEIAKGMAAVKLTSDDKQNLSGEFRESIAVLPFSIAGTRAGYIGIYASEILAQELFNIDKFNLIDRQTLNLQLDEIAKGEIVAEDEALKFGKTKGVKYFITGTFYEPDVAETSTGVPIKGILATAELLTGENLGSEYASNVEVKNLKATVKITIRVVNVETGAVEFMCTEMAQASGKSQVNLERGLLGGAKINGGATAFTNTITGQATFAVTKTLANDLVRYFNGEIKTRNYTGTIVNAGTIGKPQNDTIVNGLKKNKFSVSKIEITEVDTLAKCRKLSKNKHYILYMPELVKDRDIVKENTKINIKDYKYIKVGTMAWKEPGIGILTLNNTYNLESLKDSVYIKFRKKFIHSFNIGLANPAVFNLYDFRFYPYNKKDLGWYAGLSLLSDLYKPVTGASINVGYSIRFAYNSGISIGVGLPFGKSDWTSNDEYSYVDDYLYFKYQFMLDASLNFRFFRVGFNAVMGKEQYKSGYYYEYDEERTNIIPNMYLGVCF